MFEIQFLKLHGRRTTPLTEFQGQLTNRISLDFEKFKIMTEIKICNKRSQLLRIIQHAWKRINSLPQRILKNVQKVPQNILNQTFRPFFDTVIEKSFSTTFVFSFVNIPHLNKFDPGKRKTGTWAVKIDFHIS